MTSKNIGAIAFVLWLVSVVSASAEENPELMVAAGHGDMKMVTALLDKGANVNSQDGFGFTALMFAAKGGYTDVVKLLLARGAEVNVQSKLMKYTALMNAASFGDVAMVKALLKKGAQVNARNDDGVTALTFAEEAGKADIVTLLKQHGARK